MRAYRLATLLLAATIGLAACGSSGEPAAGETSAAPASSAPAEPEELLKAATAEIDKGNYRFTFTGGPAAGEGYVHKPSGGTRLTVNATYGADKTVADILVAGNDTFVKLALNGEPLAGGGKWLEIDKSKVTADGMLDYVAEVDVPGASRLLATARSVSSRPTGEIAGTVDVSKVKGVPSLDDEETISALGAWASAVPFVATLDGDGRLTKLVLDLSSFSVAGIKAFEFGYSDYGAAEPAAKPAAGDVTAAPANLYEDFL